MASADDRSRTPLRLLAVAAAALLTVVSCGPPAADDAALKEQAAALDIELPIDAYRLDPKAEADYFHAQNLLVSACMEEAGFDWPVAEEDTPDENPHQRRYGVVDPHIAEQLGYHGPPSLAEDDRVSDERVQLLDDEDAAAAYGGSGAGDGEEGGAEGEDGQGGEPGCIDLADEELSSGAEDDADYELFTTLDWESLEDSESHPDVEAAMGAWSACMADQGHSYTDVWSAMEDDRWNLDQPEPPEDERETAVDDVRCKYETGLLDTWIAAESEIQQNMIDDNAAELEKVRDANAVYERNAEAVLAESGK